MILPVSDVDRAKAFYVDKVGFVVDHDVTVSEAIRFVQLDAAGLGLLDRLRSGPDRSRARVGPGDADRGRGTPRRAYDELFARGVDVSGVDDLAWGRFVTFADPDGNRWALQATPAARLSPDAAQASAA